MGRRLDTLVGSKSGPAGLATRMAVNAGHGHPGVRTPDPSVTVVIATRDRPKMLSDTLGAVRAALRIGDRIVVVDSASRSSDVRAIAEPGGATVLRCDRPGACLARNRGLREATTEIVAFTDDDCLPKSDWLHQLSAAFGRSPAPDFVTGRVLPIDIPPGRGQILLSVAVDGEPRTIMPGSDPSNMGHGANMAWRREVLAGIGGFDESLGPGAPFRAAEDHDVFWRALQEGFSGAFEPSAVVMHRQWRSRRQQLATSYAYGVGSGALAVKYRRMAHSASQPGRRLNWPQTLSLASTAIVWPHGITGPLNNLRKGYRAGVLVDLAMLAGGMNGLMRARAVPLSDGRYS